MVTNAKRKRKLYKYNVMTYNVHNEIAGYNPYCTVTVKAVSILGAKLAYRKQYRKDVDIISVYPYIPY